MEELTTTSSVMDALGGNLAVAQITKSTPKAVWNWRGFDTFPSNTYVAMTDSRPFSEAISESEAKRYLTEWAGIEFDPKVVKVFLELKDLKELESYSK